MRRALLVFSLASMTAMTASHAADSTQLTIYRSDAGSLYSSTDHGASDAGRATIHEQREVKLSDGLQTIHFDGLPSSLDTEALAVFFPDHAASVAARRLLLPGQSGLLAAHEGSLVKVLGDSGNVLAQGTLRGSRDGLLVEANGSLTLVKNYAAVQLADANIRSGAQLELAVQAQRAGSHLARLDYATGGLGWRAAYSATLHDGATCRMDFTSLASIANRSGRDWHTERLTLVAGEPHFDNVSAPQPMMSRARGGVMAMAAAPPAQAEFGDYRSYTLDGVVELPDDSVTQVPLYPARSIDCQRSWLYESGNAWSPQQPMLERDYLPRSRGISSRLGFKAFDSLPAGYLRVASVINGQHELLGEARINDTAKDRAVEVELGTPFDLHADRERTAFQLDRATHTLNEAFRITLSNTSAVARTITVREHPPRWREWTLASSSQKPASQSVDTLDFAVVVPANGKTTLDYALRYHWTAQDEN
ncbi:MAG TPA: DUF4139 domain-containing protein [Rhodanobacteraceae bacterium]|nr:DUF4139 domain-containing protein [Rhodanobacteraceae bacterium]